MYKGDNMKQQSRERKHRFLLFLFCTFLLSFTTFIIFEIRITPVLEAMAESKAKNIASEAVNDAVHTVLCEKEITYDNIVHRTTDESGKITSVTVDSIRINQLCAEIRTIITDKLNSLGEKSVSIPVGSLSGIDMFAGKGPGIEVGITLSGSAVTKMWGDFQTAGINQTRHQMILEVQTKIYVITQNGNISTEILNSIVVAETVIVGQVPEIYSDGTDELWQNLI